MERLILRSMSSIRAGECVAGSTRLAWCTGEDFVEEELEAEDAGERSMSNIVEGSGL
jgi:hypothetical protein